ncbi:Nitroreductase domain-containing protein [Aphelenchoides besseyi]|nr:Nitroreductase domain-containing protein [Aphelenchoides besseyi]KAI6200824.1 Nitroreductase domain-containing protein [Aphelenchoides besseyi]
MRDIPVGPAGLIRRLFTEIEPWHLNVTAATLVIAFICHQIATMFRRKQPTHPSKTVQELIALEKERNARQSISTVAKREFVDKQVGSDLDVVDSNEDYHHAREIRYIPMEFSETEMLKRSQKFYELMKMRRSVRVFSDREVPLKLIQNLVKTAGTAPSGCNLQPWTFCVVHNAAIKRRLREIVEDEEQVNYTRRMGAKWVLDVSQLNVNWNKPYITEAPYLIVVMKHIYQVKPNGERQATYYNEISTSISTGLLLAAIQNAGLCTVVTTPLNAGGRIRELLQRPDNEKAMLLLPLGYCAEETYIPDLQRRRLEEIIRLY